MKMMSIFLSLVFMFWPGNSVIDNLQNQDEPLRIAVAGLTHDHAHWIFGRENRGDIVIVGIYESNEEVRQRYAKQYHLNNDLFYSDLERMLDTVNPEAVTAFGSTYDHLSLVEASAPRNIHVMVEKPLAVNIEHASRMRDLAEEHGIYLLTNYETTWYASNQSAYDMIHHENMFGEIRKMIVSDGHQGPKEIGISDEFFEWLTDPVLNGGGGALMDFGCYGANLMTWMMNGEEPLSVTAVTKQIKPDIYPRVDDDATIIVNYPEAQGIIQASWNWPYNRKDMHIYGQSGYVFALDAQNLEILKNEQQPSEKLTLDSSVAPYDDPFSYFAGVIRGTVEMNDTDLSSLANNMTVVKILDAAKESAKTGKTVNFQ